MTIVAVGCGGVKPGLKDEASANDQAPLLRLSADQPRALASAVRVRIRTGQTILTLSRQQTAMFKAVRARIHLKGVDSCG